MAARGPSVSPVRRMTNWQELAPSLEGPCLAIPGHRTSVPAADALPALAEAAGAPVLASVSVRHDP